MVIIENGHKRNGILILLLSSVFAWSQAQKSYDVSLSGRLVGDGGSDASFQTVGLNVSLFKKPIKKGQKGIVSLSANYSTAYIEYKNSQDFFDAIEDLQSIGVTLGYYRRLKNPKWSFIGRLSPKLNSNFTHGIQGDDFYISALALWNYSKQRNTTLSFGLAYSNTLGFPAPIPVINYWKRFNEKWEMNLGFPRTNITHHVTEKSSMIGYFELQGYNGNISENIVRSDFENQRIAERISYRDIITGLEYRYQVEKFQLKLNAGYTIDRRFELQNSDNDTAYTFNMENNINVGVGFGFNF